LSAKSGIGDLSILFLHCSIKHIKAHLLMNGRIKKRRWMV
jgi:hypothetical protein